MKLKKLIAGMTAFLLIYGALPVAEFTDINFGQSISASAAELKVVEDSVTSDGFRYEIYGTKEWDEGKGSYVIRTRDYAVITSYVGSENAIEIPSIIADVPVTQIASYAFYYNFVISTVKINENIKAIGEGAFSECINLSKIDIPESITFIDAFTFSNCPRLTSITIPDSVRSIGEGVFSGDRALTNINLPKNLKSISNNLFENCSHLTSVNIPESVTSIGDHAFKECSDLTDITIPSKVTSIGEGAFHMCTGLVSVDIQRAYFL